MSNGFPINIEKIGYFFWFILSGLTIVVFSIIYNDDYVLLGLLLSFYGNIGFLTDLIFDRYISAKKNQKMTAENIHEASISHHIFRYIAQIALIVILIITIECKYNFFNST